MAQTAQAPEKKKSSRGWWLLLLLLLLLLGGGAYWWFYMRDTGSFALTFRACDESNRCGRFKIFAPGYDYRWSYGKTQFDQINGSEPSLADAIGDDLKKSKAVIAAGLASREGGDLLNRRLSSCRSKRLATLLGDAKTAVGSQADIDRIALGRYVEDVNERDDTQLERLVVLAFVLEADAGLNMDQALRKGLSRELPEALKAVLAPIAKQLDFTRYACWNDQEFHITPTDEVRSICFQEPTSVYGAFCGDF